MFLEVVPVAAFGTHVVDGQVVAHCFCSVRVNSFDMAKLDVVLES